MEDLLQDKDRIIDVAWYNEETEGTYNVDIEILSMIEQDYFLI